jgi:hypothetical protein
MPAPDPIKPVIDALAVLAKPNPVAINATPQAPSAWAGSATEVTSPIDFLAVIGTLMTALYGASTDMNKVGQDIGKALDEVIKVANQLATSLAGITANDVDTAMDGLKQAMALAQTLLPGDQSTVLDSASKLFQQIHDLIESIGAAKGAAELAQLAQVLKLIKTKIAI